MTLGKVDVPAKPLGQTVVILGATSAMAIEVARLYAEKKAALILVGRDGGRLEALARDLLVRGAKMAKVVAADLADIASFDDVAQRLLAAAPALDVVLVAYGVLGEQERGERDGAHAELIMRTNYLAPALLIERLASPMAARGSGVIAAIGSVAGDRGRASNYFYGSAKAGLAAYLSGLRNRLAKRGVAVVTILPGFVATPMTAHLAKGPLVAHVEKVGEVIFRAIEKRRDVVYAPWFWRYIMLIIRSIPERIFKRLSL